MRRRLRRSAYTPPQVAIAFDSDSLSSMVYNGVQYLHDGAFVLDHIKFENGSGGTTDATVTGDTPVVNAGAGTVTRTFAWGSGVAKYEVFGSRVAITVTVTNGGATAIRGVRIRPASLLTSEEPDEYGPGYPIMMIDPGEPGIASLTTSAATIAFTHDDHNKPIVAGFPGPANSPTNTQWGLSFNTYEVSGYPEIFPNVIRPIAVGQSEVFRFSIRFGPAGSSVASVASATYSEYRATYPAQLNWTDRRIIGQLVAATADAGYANNPRGWFLDSTININTGPGLTDFATKAMLWADNAVIELLALNCQGMIMWDIEGEEYPHATTYIGDPTQIATVAPEMHTIADAFFAKFTAAGLKVGVCIRPQTFVHDGEDSYQDYEPADPLQNLLDKVAYAKTRWGCTLFYVDSNGDPNLPIDAGIFAAVLAAHPDILLIPEHENTRYYAYSAPYGELDQDFTGTSSRVRLTYPGAWSIVYVPDGNVSGYHAALVSAVASGDVLVPRAWYHDSINDDVTDIYDEAT